MKRKNVEEAVLNALRVSGADVSVADIVRRGGLNMPRGNVSSRLCELRAKGLVQSRQEDGINYWTLTEDGLRAVVLPDSAPDISAPEITPELEGNQPIDGDISPDISADISDSEHLAVPTFTERFVEQQEAIMAGKLAVYSPSFLESLRREQEEPVLPDELDWEPEAVDAPPPMVSDALVTESLLLKQRRPLPKFAKLDDALFVLDTLCMDYCRDMPNYREELGRIADYLREAA